MNIAAYCRVSTDKSDQLNSLETQKRFFTEYTLRTGHTLTALYADEGISGTKVKNRRAFQQLMSDAQAGRFELLVVKDISRFARNTVDFLQSIRTLKALGIETQFLTANMTTMGGSEFVLTIFGALAQEESANTSKRIKFGKRQSAQLGRVPNLVFGYDKSPNDRFTLTVNAQEAATVQDIFRWYLQDGAGTSIIAARLNSMGITTKQGFRWTSTAVCRVLKNALYTGKIINGREEVSDFLTGARTKTAEDTWLVTDRPALAVITDTDFQAAQALLSRRGDTFKAGQRRSGPHLFSGLLGCGCCGHSFRRTVRTYRQTYVRWSCGGRSSAGSDSCTNRTGIDEHTLIAALQTYALERMQSLADPLEAGKARLLQLFRQQVPSAGNRRIAAALGRQKQLRQRLMDMYADGLINRTEFEERLTSLRLEIARLEAQTEAQKNCAETSPEAAIAVLIPAKEAFVDLSRLSCTQLRRWIRQITVQADGSLDIYIQPLD